MHFALCIMLGGAGEGDDAGEVAADEVAHDDHDVDGQDFAALRDKHVGRQHGDVERIGYAVQKAAQYEYGHAEKQRQEFAFSRKLNHRGHDEAASHTHKRAGHESQTETAVEYCVGAVHKRGLRIAHDQGREHASQYVARKNEGQLDKVAPRSDETRHSGVEFPTVVNHGEQSEREQYGSGYAADPKITN